MSDFKQRNKMSSQIINDSMYDANGGFPEIICPVCNGKKFFQIGTATIPCAHCKGRGSIPPVFEENA